MKAFELRTARSLLGWTTEDLAYSCGVAAQSLQRSENEMSLSAFNQDLGISARNEYWFRESMSWAGVDRWTNDKGQLSFGLKPWAACVRPFEIRVFPYLRPEEGPLPRGTFVRFGWVEPKMIMNSKSSKDADQVKPAPVIISLPNEPDIFSPQQLDMEKRAGYLAHAMNVVTMTYRQPFLKRAFSARNGHLNPQKGPVPLIYIELDGQSCEWLDIFFVHMKWDWDQRGWAANESIRKVCRIKTDQINQSLRDNELIEKLSVFSYLKEFWLDKALQLESFLHSSFQLLQDYSSELWQPGYCNRNKDFMRKLKLRGKLTLSW